jgi:hypothetical protein
LLLYTDKNTVKVGVFRAIAGLTNGNVENQKKFSAVPRACSCLIKALYEDIEYEETALCKN